VILQHFLKMPVTQWIGRVPANAVQSHINWKSHSLRALYGLLLVFTSANLSRAGSDPLNAIEPRKPKNEEHGYWIQKLSCGRAVSA
jgi:hypothetical protein